MTPDEVLRVGGRRLKLSNPDKVLYPAAGFTKRDVVGYYRAIAPVLLPHLKGRPLTMKRYPNGVDQEFFYQKEAPQHRPEWIRTVPVWSRSNKRDVNFLIVDTLSALVWIANLADLELHTSLSRAGSRRGRRCWCSTSTPARRPRLSSAAGWACCCGTCLRRWASSASPRRRARRGCRCTCR